MAEWNRSQCQMRPQENRTSIAKGKVQLVLIFLRKTSRCYQRPVKAEKKQADNIFNNCHRRLVKLTLWLKSLNLLNSWHVSTRYIVFFGGGFSVQWSSPRFDSGARLVFLPLQFTPRIHFKKTWQFFTLLYWWSSNLPTLKRSLKNTVFQGHQTPWWLYIFKYSMTVKLRLWYLNPVMLALPQNWALWNLILSPL